MGSGSKLLVILEFTAWRTVQSTENTVSRQQEMIGSIRLLLIAVSVAGLSRATPIATEKWGYRETTEEELGPADWKLSYPSCGGTHQSPINFPMSEISNIQFWDVEQPPLHYGGDCEKFTLKKLEDLYKWEIHEDEHCTVKSVNSDEREYTLLQFHMHMTSEHTINDYHHDAELHFVHKDVSGSGKLLVMGVFLNTEKGATKNAFIKNLLDDMEADDETLDLDESNTNYADLLNSLVMKSHLINYSGSLTTPACSEIVEWWVLNTPISISHEDLQRMETLYGELPATNGGSDNRPTQPLNDREIHYFYRRPRTEKNCCGREPAVVADPF